MRKYIFLFLYVFLMLGIVFAEGQNSNETTNSNSTTFEDATNNTENKTTQDRTDAVEDKKDNGSILFEVQNLISAGLFENRTQISKESNQLSEVERLALYNNNKISAGLGFALNFFIGFGIGSLVQHDKYWTMYLISDILLPVCLGALYRLSMNSENPGYFSIFVGGYIICRIIECIRPLQYARLYNQQLSGVLSINANVSFVIKPYENNNLALATGVKIKF